MNFILSSDDISVSRNEVINRMITPVLPEKTRVNIYTRPIARKRVIGVSGISKLPTDTDYRDWRFNTAIQDFSCSYFEIWIPFERENYYLDRAYFHVYKDDMEYVLLHSDPNEHLDEDNRYINYKYKQSPHIHVGASIQPLPHSHIALNQYDLDTILSSIDEFNKAMEINILMIAREFIGITI